MNHDHLLFSISYIENCFATIHVLSHYQLITITHVLYPVNLCLDLDIDTGT